MRVFADFHHHALFESLRILFVDRFGWELYRPIGMEWWEQELWNYERHQGGTANWNGTIITFGEAVARQYLMPQEGDRLIGDHWERDDRRYRGDPFRMVTLEQFREQEWDFIIATLDHNEPAYARLAAEKDARFGIEIGNQWGSHAWDLHPFVLSAVTPEPWPQGIEAVTLRQEFNLDQFRYEPPQGFGPISSFMQCYPEGAGYSDWIEAARAAPEFDWRVYGAYGTAPDDEWKAGEIEAVDDIAAAMRASSLGWHVKRWSDGYGHVLHNWFALGRPILAWASYYDGRLDGLRRISADLFVEGVTSFNICGRNAEYVAGIICDLAQDQDRYLRMCEATAARFRQCVDFDAEADAAHMLLTGEHARKLVAA